MRGGKLVYFCADDYGISKECNTRIRKCLSDGVLNKISILPNGDCFKEFSSGNIDKLKWTKDYILSTTLASNYVIHTINGEDYLIMDWKSGDYVFGGEIYGCYVFKKNK